MRGKMSCSIRTQWDWRVKGRFVLTAKSISETQRVQYLLGLSSPAEREHREREYFEDEDAFQEMLAAEDDLIDAYARGELVGEEQRRFEKSFVSSFRGRDRVQFARAFAGALSDPQPVKTKHRGTWLDGFKILQSPGLLRTAMIAAVMVFVVVLTWLVIDRWRMTNELRDLRLESAELSKRTEALLRSSDNQRTRTAEIATQPADLQAQSVKPGHRERATMATHRATPDGLSVEPFNTYALVPRNTTSKDGGSVRGTAKDSNGNLVSGATVTLTDSARNFTRTQFTNKDGTYVFSAIPPGTYFIEVKAPGFKTASASGLAVLVDTPTVRDMQLEVGSDSESVNTTAAAEATINTSDATLGNSFERKLITELPLNANDVVGLLSLQPGVSRTGFVNGGRTDQSNITLDGVDVNSRIPSSLSWIRFQLMLKTAAIHDDYRVTIKTADGRVVSSVDWTEPLTSNQTIINTPAISTVDLLSGQYVLLLMAKEPDGSFVKIAEYSFKIIKY